MIAKDGARRVTGGRDGQQEMLGAEITVPEPVGVLHGGGENGNRLGGEGSMPGRFMIVSTC